jgi:hypothetical protein
MMVIARKYCAINLVNLAKKNGAFPMIVNLQGYAMRFNVS